MTPRPNPAFYLVSVFFGYYAGLNAHGSWWPLFYMVLAFFGIALIIKLGRMTIAMF